MVKTREVYQERELRQLRMPEKTIIITISAGQRT
jgi:hypothetical protein